MQHPTFRSSIALDFFSVKALQVQIGRTLSVWPLALLKELIDNALDSCELQGMPPDIAVTVEADALSVRDNGGDLPEAALPDSLDYTIRVNEKSDSKISVSLCSPFEPLNTPRPSASQPGNRWASSSGTGATSDDRS